MNPIKAISSLAVLGLLITGCGKNGPGSQTNSTVGAAIVGGSAVSRGEFPSVVAITKNGRRVCTGNLTSQNTILSAAHCIQVSDFQSKEQVMSFLNKVAPELEKLAKKETTPFEKLDIPKQRSIMKAAIKSAMIIDAKALGIAQGLGQAGGQMTSEKIIIDVTIDDRYVDAIFSSIFGMSPLAKGDTYTRYSQIADKVTFKISKKLKGVTPVPAISPDEHLENVLLGQDVTIVGYGLKVDNRYLAFSGEKISIWTQAIKKEKAKPEGERDEKKIQELTKQVETELPIFLKFMTLYQASGTKEKVTLKLENYDHKLITLRAKAAEAEQGACNGDSGGPAFVKLANGEWRQLGVMVTVDFCGRTSHVSPVFRQ